MSIYDGDFTLHTDKYEINMMHAHWTMGTHNRKAVFEALIYENGDD